MRQRVSGPAATGELCDSDAGRADRLEAGSQEEILAQLIEAQVALAAAVDVDAIVQLMLARTLAIADADGVALAMLDGEELVIRTASGASAGAMGHRLSLEGSAAGRALKTGEPYWVERVSEEEPLLQSLVEQIGDGSILWVPMRSREKPVGCIGVVRRAGRPQLARAELQMLELLAGMLSSALTQAMESEALNKFEALFRNAPLGIALMTFEGEVFELNEVFGAIHRVARGDNLQARPERIHPDDRALTSKNLAEFRERKADVPREEIRVLQDDGSVRWIDTGITVVRDARGEPQFAVMMSQDVTERKRAELGLLHKTEELAAAVDAEEEARAKFEAIFRDAPIGIGLLDADGQFLEVNQALASEQLLGLAEHRGKSPHEFVHPDDFERASAGFGQVLKGERNLFRLELRVKTKEGYRWRDSTVSFVRNADDEIAFGVVMAQDVTERKRTEEELREQSERLAAIVETQAEIAAAGSDLDKVMQLATERSVALTTALGSTVSMLEGDDLVVHFGAGEAASMVGQLVPLAQSTGKVAIETGRAVHVDSIAAEEVTLGSGPYIQGNDRALVFVPLFSGVKPVGYLIAGRPSDDPLSEEEGQTVELLGGMLSSAISRAAELEAQRERVAALSRFETIWRHSPIGIGFMSLEEQGRWIDMNGRLLEINGCTRSEAGELMLSDYTHPDDTAVFQAEIAALLSGEREAGTVELRHYRRNGELFWTNSSVSLGRDSLGHPEFAIVMAEDITQTKLASLALRRNAERLSRIVETQADVAAAGSDLRQALKIVAERAQTLTHSEGACVNLIEGDEVVTLAATGLAKKLTGTRRVLATSITGAAIAAGEALLIEDAPNDPRMDSLAIATTGERSHVCALVYRGGEVIGSLHVNSASEEDPLTEEDRQTLELLSVVLSSAVSRTAEVEALTKFETIYRDAPIGIGLMGLDGRFIEVNEMLRLNTGHAESFLLEQPIASFTHPDDADEAVAQWEGMLRGDYDSYRIEFRLFGANGEIVWINSGVSLVHYPDGTPRFAVVMSQDVTQRKQDEVALQENGERLARIVATQAEVSALGPNLDGAVRLIVDRVVELTRAEGSSVSFVEGEDLVTRASTGIAADVPGYRRPLALTMTARSMDLGQPILSTHAENDSRLYRPLIAKTHERSHICVPLRGEEGFAGSLIAQSASEHDRLSEEDVRTIELLAVVLSSAISRAAEAEALGRFEAIFNDAPIGIGLLTLDGVLVDANAAMVDITGYELSGQPISAYTHPDDVEAMVADFRRLVRGELDSYRFEARHFRKDGELAWIDSAVTLLRDPDGTPRFALTMAQDVTTRRAAEEELRQSQKIEAIGQLSAGIAHDFNNLLMGVLGYAGLARGEVDPDSRIAEYLSKIETTGHRAASLTKQLLAFGRRQTLQPRVLDLNELVSETLSMLSRLLGEQIEILPRLDPLLPSLLADPTQLQQVLFNLALNARDAMPNGGRLTIATTSVDISADENTDSDLAPGAYVVLSVSDTGMGMSEGVRARIFEPFFTTKGVGEGTGLGLSSVHGIVKQSHGDIYVLSEPGKGATFQIYLPAAVVPELEASPGRGTTAAERPRVLVVEDAAVVRELVSTLLGKNGYEVFVVADPEEAVLLAQSGPMFDVLITDLVLARTTGPHVVARVQEHQPSLRVLYVSAYEPDTDIDPDLVIRKPFSNDDLLGKLEELLAREAGV